MENSGKENNTLLGLKSIRLFCFLAIYVHHAYPGTKPFEQMASLSVSIFIVLSGFILSYRYREENNQCKSLADCFKFGIRRIKKLYPLHLIIIVFFMFYWIYIGGIYNCLKLISPSMFLQIFLIQSWSLSYEVMQWGNAVSWFLSAILFLYILFPLIHKKTKNLDSKFSLIVILACIAIQGISFQLLYPIVTTYIDFSEATYYFPLARIFEFISGCCLFNVWDKTRNIMDKRVSNTIELLVFIVILYYIFISDFLINMRCNYFVTILSCLSVYLFANCSGFLTNMLTNKFTVRFGDYSNYAWLIHCFFIQLLSYINYFYDLEINTAVLVIIGIAITFYLSHLYMDYFLKYQQKRNVITSLLVSVCILLSFTAIRIMNLKNSIIDDLSNYSTVTDSIDYWVDSAEIIDNQVEMIGWAYPLDENVQNYEIGVEVYGKIYIANKVKRTDVQETFGLNTSAVGFDIFLDNNEYYQICIVDQKTKTIYK